MFCRLLFLLCTEMVRTLHQHLHAVDRHDAHAQQADGSELREGFVLAKLCAMTPALPERKRSSLTTRPAFLTAKGKLSSPVPMFPLRMWMRVWKTLRVTHTHTPVKDKRCHASALFPVRA